MLYNAGKQTKFFRGYKSYANANNKYQTLLANNKILFPKFSNFLHIDTDYELVMLGPPGGKHFGNTRDELGRNITLMAPKGCSIKKIDYYMIEDTFKHKNTDKKYQFREFAKDFIVNKKGTKAFYTVKNKLVISYFDNDDIDVFVVKCMDDAIRLNDTVKQFCIANDVRNNMFFPIVDRYGRMDIYDAVEEKLGIARTYMSRESTR